MNRSHATRRIAVGLVVAVAGLVSVSTAAWAASDGPPTVETLTPQSGPPTGGVPVRIVGTGFRGTTSVRFGSTPATRFAVIDSRLITAVVPPLPGGADNTFVDVTVTDAQGSSTQPNGFYYTNATITVTPSTNLHPGQEITVKVRGYQPNANLVVVEVNPLLVYVEGGPDFPPGPPPYASPMFFGVTDANGNLTVKVRISNMFNTGFDPNAQCPANQTTVDFLGTSAPVSAHRPTYSAQCLIAVSQVGQGTIDTPVSFAGDLAPQPPVLTLNRSSANQGDVVRVGPGSVRWNANPLFGSSTAAGRPGQTKVELEICGIGNDPQHCSATTGSAIVTPTRYIDQTFRGARLFGYITVGADVPGNCTTCFVRARQFRPGGGFIEDTAKLRIT